MNDVEKLLDDISPTFCLAKWLYVQIHLPHGLTQSCYHPPAHKIPLDELEQNPSALHNTKFKIAERKQMVLGKKPPGCEYCWKIEELKNSKQISDRLYRSSEDWAFNNYDYVTDNEYKFNVKPAYLEVNFSHTCNQKCIYCSPHLSSSWYEEIEQFGKFNLLAEHENKIIDHGHNDIAGLEQTGKLPFEVRKENKIKKKDNPYVKAFWKWLPDIYDNLHHFRMTGGEPLMHKDTFKMLNYILENPSPNLQIGITTNLCPSNNNTFKNFIKILKKLENPIDNNILETWKKNNYLKEITYFAKNDHKNTWHNWPRFIVENKEIIDNQIEPTLFRIDKNKITGKFNNDFINENTGDFFYKKYWIKPINNEWKCLGDNEELVNDFSAYKHLMIYVSLDSVSEQAEYIRYPLNFEQLKNNVHAILQNLNRVTVSFINTFNILSICKIESFLKFINEFRELYDNKVLFDIPFLEYPNWLAIDIITKDFLQYMYDAEYYMKEKSTFSKEEIKKFQRNIRYMEDKIYRKNNYNIQRKNFALYIDQLDRRRNTNFLNIFPEYKEFYNLCKQD